MTDAALVVQRQLDAYNAKDLPALLATYSPRAEHHTLHGGLLAQGHEALAERFKARFAEPDLHARLLTRSVVGQMVVDVEQVTRNLPQGPAVVELLCVYEVRDGLIHKASFHMGTTRWLAPSPEAA